MEEVHSLHRKIIISRIIIPWNSLTSCYLLYLTFSKYLFMKPIPERKRIPVLTDLLEIRQMVTDPLGFCRDKVKKYGDVCYVPIPGSRNYMIHDPEIIREFLVAQSGKFRKSRLYRAMWSFLGDGLLTSNGSYHTQQRKLAAPAFHRQRIQEYAHTMVQCTRDEIRNWEPGDTVNVSQAMTNIALQVVTKTLFNSEMDAQRIARLSDRMRILLDTAGEIFKNPLYLLCLEKNISIPIVKKLHTLTKEVNEDLLEIITAYRKDSSIGRGDLLSMLMEASDEATGIGMTDKQLRDEVMTMFMAGHETTATALTWTWYLLGKHPEVADAFYREVGGVIGTRIPKVEDYQSLPFTKNIFKETLRLYPPAWTIAREATEDVTIQDYHFTKGSALAVVIYLMHRNEKYFADPDAFIPQRWDDEKMSALPKFVYFPFGAGNRMCIGEGFAWMEAVMILATMGSTFRLKLPEGFETSVYAAFTLRQKDAVMMKVVA